MIDSRKALGIRALGIRTLGAIASRLERVFSGGPGVLRQAGHSKSE